VIPELTEAQKQALEGEVHSFLKTCGFVSPEYKDAADGLPAVDTATNSPLPHPYFWNKKLDGGLFVHVENKIWFRKRPVISVEVKAPDRLNPDLGIKQLLSATMIALDARAPWPPRLREQIYIYTSKADELATIKCPHCGGFMAERTVKKEGELCGKKFLGCIEYPNCRGMRAAWKQVGGDDDGKQVNANCPDCQSPLVVRYAKKGPWQGNKFLGCSGYPACKRIVSPEEAMALMFFDEPAPKQPDDPWGVQ
jgi:ssDNA-binding Zn-finger/Zn-ribbon topoisomerase 1